MSVQVENLEKNMAKLTVTVSADKLEKAIQAAYERQKGRIRLPGFRVGKVPRKMLEKAYGVEIFYEDAANALINQEYPDAMEESGLDIVSRPNIDIEQIESGKEFIFTAEVAVRPEVKLGEYMGVAVTKIDTGVTDEEVDAEIENTRNMQSRTVEVTDRPIQEGDTAVIDFEGFVDGVPFEGGKGENHPLEIGSHSFIDTFEEQLVGKNAEDEVDVNVTFPEQYHAEELAGKPAVFKVKIHEIRAKELPELDDEFASLVSEFETLAEYKEDLKKKLAERKEETAKRTKEEEAVQKIVEKSEMEIPEPMIDMQCENMARDFEARLMQQGLSMEQYMQFSGMTMEKLLEQLRPDAEKRIKNSLVLEEIVKAENIEASEDDVEAELAKMAENYGMDADKLKEQMGESERESIKKELSLQKAVEFVMEHAEEQEKSDSEEA